jgi:hypothetical protein
MVHSGVECHTRLNSRLMLLGPHSQNWCKVILPTSRYSMDLPVHSPEHHSGLCTLLLLSYRFSGTNWQPTQKLKATSCRVFESVEFCTHLFRVNKLLWLKRICHSLQQTSFFNHSFLCIIFTGLNFLADCKCKPLVDQLVLDPIYNM